MSGLIFDEVQRVQKLQFIFEPLGPAQCIPRRGQHQFAGDAIDFVFFCQRRILVDVD